MRLRATDRARPADSNDCALRSAQSRRPGTAQSPRRWTRALPEALLGAHAAGVVDELIHQRAPQSASARVRHDGDVENLRFARAEHQHAEGDDPPGANADARRISGGERVGEIAERPWRRMNLGLERCDDDEVVGAKRAPRLTCGTGNCDGSVAIASEPRAGRALDGR